MIVPANWHQIATLAGKRGIGVMPQVLRARQFGFHARNSSKSREHYLGIDIYTSIHFALSHSSLRLLPLEESAKFEEFY